MSYDPRKTTFACDQCRIGDAKTKGGLCDDCIDEIRCRSCGQPNPSGECERCAPERVCPECDTFGLAHDEMICARCKAEAEDFDGDDNGGVRPIRDEGHEIIGYE